MHYQKKPSSVDRNWCQSMRPRQTQNMMSLHNAARTKKPTMVSPNAACMTPVSKNATIRITTWEKYGMAQRTCHTLWKYLNEKGGILKQKVTDRIFKHITKLEEVLLDAKQRIQFK